MSSSETTDLDGLESSESESETTDWEGQGTSNSGYSGSSDSEYSDYSQCFDSSSSDVALPDWDEACERAKPLSNSIIMCFRNIELGRAMPDIDCFIQSLGETL